MQCIYIRIIYDWYIWALYISNVRKYHTRNHIYLGTGHEFSYCPCSGVPSYSGCRTIRESFMKLSHSATEILWKSNPGNSSATRWPPEGVVSHSTTRAYWLLQFGVMCCKMILFLTKYIRIPQQPIPLKLTELFIKGLLAELFSSATNYFWNNWVISKGVSSWAFSSATNPFINNWYIFKGICGWAFSWFTKPF